MPNEMLMSNVDAPKTAPSILLPSLCFLITGMSALIAEVCWIRKASLAFGSSTWALSVVLAVFFGGLALGSYLAGRLSRRLVSPIRGYACLELGVGLMTMLSPVLFVASEAIYDRLYTHVYDSIGLLALTRVLLVAMVMLPATTLMGGTLPLFCQQFVRTQGRVARGVGVFYGVNTLGAAGGAALCGFWLVPTIGLNASIGLAGILNLLVGVVAFRLASAYAKAPLPTKDEANDARAFDDAAIQNPNRRNDVQTNSRLVTSLFFGIGFVAVGFEVLWTRYLSIWMPNTVHTYTLTLTIVLLGIVIGSSLSALISDRFPWRAGLLGATQVLAAITVMLVMQLRPEWWGDWLTPVSVGQQMLVVASVMLAPSVLSGICFPLAISLVTSDVRKTGFHTGRMTAVNLAGGILGSLTVGFLALPQLGLQRTMFCITGIGLLLGLLAWWTLGRGVSVIGRGFCSLLAIATWVAIPAVCRTQLPQDFLHTEGELVDFREGVNANVSVIRKGNQLHLEINRMWQGQNIKNHQIFAAHIPALLHPDPERVLTIGLGTGQTAKSFLLHDIERLDCVEIEDGLIQLVAKHFDSQWMQDPRVRMIVEDGRDFVTHVAEQYDIISIEVGQIYRPGIASFYTQEFYTDLRPQLRPGGLVCQFMPIEFFQPDEFRTLVETFRQVFPESVLWYNTSELLLIGTNKKQLKFDPARLQSAVRTNAELKKDLDYAYWGGPAYYLSRPENFVAGLLCGPAELEQIGQGSDTYHDDRPYLEYVPLGRDSDVANMIQLLRRNLSPFSEFIASEHAGLQAAASKVRNENLQFIPARVALARAQALQAAGQFEPAAQAYEETLSIFPNYPQANASLARFMHSQGELLGAIAFYQRSLAANPSDTDVTLELCSALVATRQFREAQRHLEQLVERQPDHSEAHSMLAAIHELHGDLEQAEIHLRQSLRSDPKQPEVLVMLGSVLLRLGRHDDAAAQFAEAKALNPDSPELLVRIGWAFGQTQRPEEALEYFRKALDIDPNATRAMLGTANVLESMGKKREAQQAYERLLAIDPAMVEARVGLAISLRSEKRWDEALRNYQAAIERMPNNPVVLAGAAWILATHPDARRRSPQQALSLAERAWQITGQQSPQAGDALAAAYAALGQFERASEVAQLTIDIAEKMNLPELAREIGNRKELYDEGKSYSE